MKISLKAIARALTGTAVALVMTETQKAVAALKQTPIGATVVADIAAVAEKSLTGPQKFEVVVANTLPLIASYVGKGGLTAAIGDVEDLGRALVQDVYNDTRSINASRVAAVILALAGK